MTVCGIKHADGVCVMGECPHIKTCCPVVWDKSGEPMTNEEWLRSCPPQELIRFLMNVAYGGQIRNVQKRTFDEEAEKWSKWLKEKHTE